MANVVLKLVTISQQTSSTLAAIWRPVLPTETLSITFADILISMPA
jgi:hypothetical protein